MRGLKLVLGLGLGMMGALGLQARGDEGPLAPYANASLGSTSAVMPSLEVTHKHFRLVGKGLRVAPVLGDGKVLGLYFQGEARMTYRSETPVEFPRLTYNLKNSTPLKAEMYSNAAVVSDLVKEGILWSPELEAQVLAGLKGEAPSPEMNEAFQALKVRARRGGITPIGFDLAQVGPGAQPFGAEIVGDRRWTYVDDTRGLDEEGLYLLMGWPDASEEKRIPEIKDVLRACLISRQRGERSWKALERPAFLLTHVKMDLKAFKNDQATMTVEETYLPMKAGLQTLRLDQYDVIAVGQRVGVRNHHWRIKSLKDDQGRDVFFGHQASELFIKLNEVATANQPIHLTFQIEGDFLIRSEGDNKWDLRTAPWFPRPALNGQFYTVEARIAVQKPLIPVASALTVSRSEEGDFNVLQCKVDKPIQFFSVSGGDFKFTEETRNGRTVRVANYAQKNTQVKRVIGLAFDIIDYYEQVLGPFPWPEYTIVEDNNWGEGQAPPAMMFISKEAFNSTHLTLAQIFSKGVNAMFAHEIAHQYWGIQVKMPSHEEQWITEAFSEFSASMFMGFAAGKSYNEGMQTDWWNGAKESNDYGTIPFANEVHNENVWIQSQIARTNLIYNKGAHLLQKVYDQVGSQAFITFFRSAQASFKWKFATTDNLTGLLNHLTKQDFKPFIEENYWGQGLPPRKK